MGILTDIRKARKSNKKKFAVLLDPDKAKGNALDKIVQSVNKSNTDYILAGGSSLITPNFSEWISELKSKFKIPIIGFPGSGVQVQGDLDGLLLLSLLSGRNADYIIGKHIENAAQLRTLKSEIMSTAYYLVGNSISTTAYVTQTLPIPNGKVEPLLASMWAAELLGFQMHYIEGGSGSNQTVSKEQIRSVRHQTQAPIWVGGGIQTPEQAFEMALAGADCIVVGTAIEQDPESIPEFAFSVKSAESLV